MVVFIPEKIKELVEGYLQQNDRRKEMGGFFFGTETEIKSFLRSLVPYVPLPCPQWKVIYTNTYNICIVTGERE
ncbi:MAG: hypothetical protein QMD46_12820 [Methanomicrobiales archaeon]|nr:hypothetical protein [Methanomicrobiales archaeon]